MAINNPYQQYQHNQVETSTPPDLTLMLYKSAIKFIKQAKQGVVDENIENANQYIIRAQDIITELMVTLDMDYEISHQLMLLYDYMKRRLIEANLKKDQDILSEVEGMVDELRETWLEAMKIVKSQKAGTMTNEA